MTIDLVIKLIWQQCKANATKNNGFYGRGNSAAQPAAATLASAN